MVSLTLCTLMSIHFTFLETGKTKVRSSDFVVGMMPKFNLKSSQHSQGGDPDVTLAKPQAQLRHFFSEGVVNCASRMKGSVNFWVSPFGRFAMFMSFSSV